MKKRNLAAMGLAGVMAVGMCMPVMAAEGEITPDTSKTKDVTIDMVQDEEYSVVIPGNITDGKVGENSSLTFSVSGAKLSPNNVLKIVATTGFENGEVTLTNANKTDATYKVTLQKDSAPLSSGEMLAFEADGTTTEKNESVDVVGDSAGVKYAGTYSGTVTFEVKCEAKSN